MILDGQRCEGDLDVESLLKPKRTFHPRRSGMEKEMEKGRITTVRRAVQSTSSTVGPGGKGRRPFEDGDGRGGIGDGDGRLVGLKHDEQAWRPGGGDNFG